MSTGAAVETTPQMTTMTGTTDQSETSCSRAGCTRKAMITWVETTTGRTLAYCAEDSVEALNIVTRWLGEPEQRINVEDYRLAIEKALGAELYSTPARRFSTGELQ